MVHENSNNKGQSRDTTCSAKHAGLNRSIKFDRSIIVGQFITGNIYQQTVDSARGKQKLIYCEGGGCKERDKSFGTLRSLEPTFS